MNATSSNVLMQPVELFALRLKFSMKNSNYAGMSCRKFEEVARLVAGAIGSL